MIQVYKPENKNYENNGDCVLHPTKCELTMQRSGEWDMAIECAALWRYRASRKGSYSDGSTYCKVSR